MADQINRPALRAATLRKGLFLKESRELLRRADASVKKVRALARGEYGELHIGYSPTPTIEILPPALAAFPKAIPGVQVLLQDMSSDEIVDGLRTGTIQFGTVTEWPSTAAPVGLSNVVEVSAGVYHSPAPEFDGSVVVWGCEIYGDTSVVGKMK